MQNSVAFIGTSAKKWKHKQFKTNRPLNMLSCSVDSQNSSQKNGGLPVTFTTHGTQRMTGEQDTGTAWTVHVVIEFTKITILGNTIS